MTRLFLYLTNTRLVSMATRGKRIVARREFAVSGAGVEEFQRYLAERIEHHRQVTDSRTRQERRFVMSNDPIGVGHRQDILIVRRHDHEIAGVAGRDQRPDEQGMEPQHPDILAREAGAPARWHDTD